MYLSKQLRNIILAYVKSQPDIFKDFGETIFVHTKLHGAFHRVQVVFLGVHKQDGLIPLSPPDDQLPSCDYHIDRFIDGEIITDVDREEGLTLEECCRLMARDKELSAAIAVTQNTDGVESEPVESDITEIKIDAYADEAEPRG